MQFFRRILRPVHVEQALAFYAKTFSEREPLCVALEVSHQELSKAYEHTVENCCFSGLSLAFFDERDDIVAQSLSMPYDVYKKTDVAMLNALAPMEVLFKKLDFMYPPKDDSVYMFALSVKDGFTNKGFGKDLISHSEDIAAKDGLRHVIADCTNVTSQYMFRRALYDVKSRHKYANFKYDCRYPFVSTGSSEIQRLEKTIVDEEYEQAYVG
jgi:ribosomal protein S18 acetylase RimI-like enzyme